MATECGNKSHSAAFPYALPEWFIKLFTNPGEVVLDPFVGSGTTIEAACALERTAIGIDVLKEYVTMSRKKLVPATGVLFG
jgi:DNA modification methylase